MAPPLLVLRDIVLGYGGAPLLDGVGLSVAKGDRVCLIGRNGSGKSTLLRIAAGLIEPDQGERFLQPGCRISYLPQEPDFTGIPTLADYAAGGLFAEEGDQSHRVAAMLDLLDLDGAVAPARLSGGEARRAALARALVGAPDILLLDEPTNHLDLPTIAWLERMLDSFAGGFVVISHDRTFLRHTTRTTLWLDRGQLRRLDAGFAAFDDWAEKVLAEEETVHAKLSKRIAEETAWARAGITARRRRNQGRLRRLAALRAERARRATGPRAAQLMAERGQLSGKLVVEAEEIAKRFGERVILRPFSTLILRGDRVGIIGPNGAGKTTLVRLLTGQLAPDQGRVRLGTNLSMAYLDQSRAALKPTETPLSLLCPGGGDQVVVQGRARHVAAYLQDFLFDPRQLRMPVGALSGGERNRLLLARALAQPSNFLVLDEPTNDLDMDTLDLLQEMLADYDGTLLLVSHDRDFLDRTVTSTIALEGDGTAVEYAGGYSDYLRQRGSPSTSASPDAMAKPSRSGKTVPPRPAARARKLSYQQQRRLDELPQLMAALEARIRTLEAALADSTLYRRDPAAFAAQAAALDAARRELAEHEEQWLELELARESLARES